MKKKVLFFLSFFINIHSFSQEIVNLVLVGDNGITEDIKKANAFIVIKKYPDGFQRLDYKISAPLRKLRSYSDSNLKVLQGNYCEYSANGAIAISGQYQENKKNKYWYYYNDTGKVILEEQYEDGVLKKSINPDTVKTDSAKKDEGLKNGEQEATFKKGDRDWGKYLSEHINGDVTQKSVEGGTVIVNFVVNKEGKVTGAFLSKSVEFVLDEEALRVIENSPVWQPAVQFGRIVNAYRWQPITFRKE